MKSVVFSALIAAAFGSAGHFSVENRWKQPVINNWEDVDHVKAFRGWKETFGKTYATLEEESTRFLTFLSNWRKINEFNTKMEHSYVLGMNQFSDMTTEQFRQYIHGNQDSCVKASERKVISGKSDGSVDAPCSSMDWSQKGVVTPVKNQGGCGSCWAFSATGSVESSYAIAHGQLNSLSEQQLVDCSGGYGNAGCNGGWMDSAFQYIQATGGLALESQYTYTATDGTCRASSYSMYDKITGYTDVSADNSDALATAVCSRPVSVAIEADQTAFQFYSGGVIDGGCGTSLDHGVLVVGFGFDSSSNLNYWKVKNSWGTGWGEQGYVRICKDCNQNGAAGECGILSAPSYPNT